MTDVVWTIGRSPTADIAVDDPYATPEHATVGIVGGQVRLADLGSTNGTWIGGAIPGIGRRVRMGSWAPLVESDRFWVGRTMLEARWIIARLRLLSTPIRVEAIVGEPIRPAGAGAR